MISLNEKLKCIRDALVAVHEDTYHYERPSHIETGRYIVWAETGEDESADADNHKVEQSISGYVDLFTRIEFDSLFDDVQNALNDIDGLSWRLNSCQFGDPVVHQSDVIHYNWSWTVM